MTSVLHSFVSRLMVLFSWAVSLLCASPQAVMFSKMKHPDLEFYQCRVQFIDSDTVYIIYNLSFLVLVYFFPLCCLLVSYVFIIYLVRGRYTL